ncbi:uncharacterized protein METZ01_LOCUS485519 [marine metagenome]|uniref:Uncharacterized protein n=1 Tax=marine metagenome TaxID=408172 RepID=A0A383CLL5_9ZZZZ
MLKRITSLMIFIAIVFGQQSKSGLELEESIIQELAKADAKEDFNSGLKWSGISTAAFIGGLYVGLYMDKDDNLQDKGWLMPIAVAFAAPIYIIHKIPVDNSRLNNLLTKNEKHRNAYRTAYEKEIRKQRLKYSLLGTGCSTVGVGVFTAVAVAGFYYGWWFPH